MKAVALSLCLAAAAISGTSAFVPAPSSPAFVQHSSRTALHAKYNSMDEILALFPEEKPVLINFYDAATEEAIKNDIFRAKTLLQDRCTVCSIKQQDYPELSKLWDAQEKSPSMILFSEGKPVIRLYEETHYLEIVAKVGQYCRSDGEEHKAFTK
uniref:Thioredoxin domain-containing protein n=1 Tax=Odontella aurita TaxID=265563 RepID=A0A7S4JZ61_9STRA|mmetsp:Transcript_57693/g.172147  ORF Transcript_57693/g.172147 Transcript_57693/m.172147 type:complete len:155 (+) Transcript_57693:169-633(+)